MSIRLLRLPITTQIELRNCANFLIGRNDFWFSARLTSVWKRTKVVSSDEDIGTTMFVLYNCTVARIEEDAFDMLLLLRQVSLDAGIPLNMKMTSARKEHFRLLYCDCEYKWLRVYFEMIPKKKQENYRPYFWWHFISLCHYPKYVRTH